MGRKKNGKVGEEKGREKEKRMERGSGDC